MIKSVVTSIILTMSFLSQAQTISGKITDTNGDTLPGVNVSIKDTYEGATTNIDGYFEFVTSETGEQTIVISYVGYNTIEVTKNVDEDLTLDFILKETVNRLSGVTITAGSFEASDEKKATVLKPLDVAMTAGASADIPAALNMLPGTTTNGETGRLFVRGGTSNETKAFVDGVLVDNFYSTTPNTVPSRSRFDPFLFKGTFFSTGGYSAEYGQALSSVLSLNSVDIAEESITDIGLLSVGGNLAHTQRWDNGSIYVKGSYTNLDPYVGVVKQAFDWKDGFTSANGTFMFRQKLNNDMLKVYGNYDQSAFHVIIPSADNPEGDNVKVNNDNTYLNTTYKKALKEGIVFAGMSYNKYNEKTDFNEIDIKEEKNALHSKLYYSGDIGSFSLKVGGELFYTQAEENNKLSDDLSYYRNFDNVLTAGFTEVDYYLTNSLTVRAGLRYSHYDIFDEHVVSPRLSMAYKTGEYSQVSAAFGQFHQLPQDDLMLVGESNLIPENSTHYMLSYQRITNDFTLRGEVYYKSYDDLVKYNSANFYDPTGYSNRGGGYARGIDLFFKDANTINNGDYWISYSFIDSKRDHRHYPDRARPEFAATHNVSVVYKHFIPEIRTQIGASWDFNSGRPYNDPNEDEFNNRKTDYYSSLSFNLAFLYRQNVIFYASASNLLGRDNVFGYEYSSTPDLDGQYSSISVGQQAKRFYVVGIFISLTKDKKINQLEYL